MSDYEIEMLAAMMAELEDVDEIDMLAKERAEQDYA